MGPSSPPSTPPAATDEHPLRVVRVLPDVAAIDREFDYAVPPGWEVHVGSRVRVKLQGRRVGGWVVAIDVEPPPGVELAPLAKLSGHGPSPDVIELARWVGDRWLGSPVKVLGTASPPRNVAGLPPAQRVTVPASSPAWVDEAFAGAGAVVRVPPAGDRWPIVEAAVARGNPLLIAPTAVTAERMAKRLRRSGRTVALMPDDWAQAAAGAIVVGTRAAAMAPGRDTGAVVVLDEHEEVLQEERTPTWHARDVAIERARRLGVPVVLVSPAPSLEAQQALPLVTMGAAADRAGWPIVEIIDRRDEQPGRMGLFSERLVRVLRDAGPVACVLNRKGRSRLLACATCGVLAACDRCDAAVHQVEGAVLACGQCDAQRPVVCGDCSGTRMKNLRMGVSRAREELEALVGEPVSEVTASGRDGPATARVTVGTEAILGPQFGRFDVVAFLDFDQELLALRQRAGAQALALLARAARLVGPRRSGGRVLVQTRTPDHVVLAAAATADVGRFTEAAEQRHRAMSWPPFSAQAEISGQGADGFVTRLDRPLGVEVQGPTGGRYLARAADHGTLLDALARTPRGTERLRIAVDPPRV